MFTQMARFATHVILALCFLLGGNGPRPSHCLSITGYGNSQISMLRHGELYATNRKCYAFEDVQPKYHGMTHIRGLNDKQGSFKFTVDVPTHVYLAVDSRYPYIHGSVFQNTHDDIMLGGCHKRTPFHVYKSIKAYPAGEVTINFATSRITAVFVRDARLIQPDAELKIVPPKRAELSMIREGEKFSTNRPCYIMTDIPPRFYGLTHVRLLNDERSVTLVVNVPVIVYVAIDSRYPNILPKSFVDTGEKIVHAGCHARTDFPVYAQKFGAGIVVIDLASTRMMAVFVEPLVDNTFKSGVY